MINQVDKYLLIKRGIAFLIIIVTALFLLVLTISLFTGNAILGWRFYMGYFVLVVGFVTSLSWYRKIQDQAALELEYIKSKPNNKKTVVDKIKIVEDTFKAELKRRNEIRCPNCGYQGKPEKVTKGHVLIELILWLCFLIPGIIYSIWRVTTRYEGCPSCRWAYVSRIKS